MAICSSVGVTITEGPEARRVDCPKKIMSTCVG